MSESKIEWTERTWNPVVGCSVLTPGCTNCYAMKMAARIEAMNAMLEAEGKRGAPHYAGTTKRVKGNAVWTGKLALAPDHILLEPLRRKKPTTYFVNSMGDLFHEDCPDEWIDKVFAVMALCPQHTFQVLTKRATRMRRYFNDKIQCASWAVDRGDLVESCAQVIATEQRHDIWHEFNWPLSNVWLGVSAERQQEADERIPLLLQTPAAIRFVSAEPLLGPIDFRDLDSGQQPEVYEAEHLDALSGRVEFELDGYRGRAPKDSTHLDWIIVGGESGPNARPMHPDWARSIRDQCAAAGVAFFFKQWGEWGPTRPPEYATHGIFENGHCYRGGHLMGATDTPAVVEKQIAQESGGYTLITRYGKKSAGRLLDGIEHNAMPSLPSALAATPKQSHAMPEGVRG